MVISYKVQGTKYPSVHRYLRICMTLVTPCVPPAARPYRYGFPIPKTRKRYSFPNPKKWEKFGFPTYKKRNMWLQNKS